MPHRSRSFRTALSLGLFGLLSCAIVSNSRGQARQTSIDSVAHGPADSVIVTALRTPTELSSVPYSTSVATTDQNVSGLSLAESVTALPGVAIDNRYNFAVGDRITNRGFGARTQFGVRGVRIIADELPLTFADGQSTLEMVDPQSLTAVEILRGPGSSLYGNASGGVILLHSKPITTLPLLAQASSTFGGDGLRRTTTQAGTRIGLTQLDGSYTTFHYGGFRDHSTSDMQRAVVRFAAPVSGSDIVKLDGGYVDFSALNPGALTAAEADTMPRKASPANVKQNASKDGIQRQLAATWQHLGDSSLTQVTAFAIGRSLSNPIVGKIIDLARTAGGMQGLVERRDALWGTLLTWSLGGDLNLQNDDRTNHVNNNGGSGSPVGALTLDQRENVTALGAFAEASMHPLEPVIVMASARYDRTLFHVTDRLITATDPDDSGDRTMDQLSPSAGLLYSVLPSLKLFANVSTAFETPTTTELANRPNGAGGFNPDLMPQRAVEYEAGLRGRADSLVSYDATLYTIAIRNELIPFEVPGAPGRSYYRNAGSARHEGAELAVSAQPLESISVRGSASWIDAKFQDYRVGTVDLSGKSVPGIAPFRAAAELTVAAPLGLRVTGIVQHVAGMPTNDSNTVTSAPYSTVDLRVEHSGITLGSTWSATLYLGGGISNLFNERYSSSITINAANGRYFEPAPGRYFFLNARLELAKHDE